MSVGRPNKSTIFSKALNQVDSVMKPVKNLFFVGLSLDAHARIQRGGGGPDPLSHSMENHKYIDFLRNIGPYPLKITKLPSHGQHSNDVSLAGR